MVVAEEGAIRTVTSYGGGAVVAVDVSGSVVGGEGAVGAVNIDLRSVQDPCDEGVVVPPPPPPSKECEGEGVRECECAELQCGSKNFFSPCVDDIRPIVP